MTITLNGAAPIDTLGVLRAKGPDAATFLHQQLSNDLLLLPTPGARLAAFCNAKGRMQASFIVIKRASDEVLLLCSRDLLARTLKRLSMFVLRAKVSLDDASTAYALWGVAGQALDSVGGAGLDRPWALRETPAGTLVALYPCDHNARALLLTDASNAPPPVAALAPDLWAWSDVHAGVATISEAVFEAFVPQMLNYESLGGVDFKKGCYPGQEVVARSQFRGTLKRRAYLAQSAVPLPVGSELYPTDEDQPCGSVVQAATAPQGGFEAIVSMQTSAFDAGQVHLAQPQGPVLLLQAMPYPLLADI